MENENEIIENREKYRKARQDAEDRFRNAPQYHTSLKHSRLLTKILENKPERAPRVKRIDLDILNTPCKLDKKFINYDLDIDSNTNITEPCQTSLAIRNS